MNNAVALAIKVTSDARGAAAGIDGATQKVNRLGQAGKVAGRLLAAGLLIAAGAALKFTNAAADDAQAQAQLAQTAQRAAGATKVQTDAMEKYISAAGLAKGVSDDELRPALSKLITATGSVGKAQKLASLAMDVSARSGKSLDSVAQSLAKAQNGSVAGLGKYGIATKDAAGHAKTLAQVQKDLGATYKGAASAGAETAAGKAKILSVQMSELQENIGTKLIPVMAKLTEIGLQVVDWIDRNQAAAGAIIGTLFGLLAILKAISIAQGVLNLVMAANPAILIAVAILALAAALVIAYKRSQTFREIVNAAFAGISAVVGAVVDFIRDHWKLLLVILGGPIGLAVVLIASHFDKVKAVAQAVIGWVQDHWPAIKAVLVAAFTDAKERITTVISLITGAIDGAKTAISTAMDGVKTAVQAVVDAFQNILDKVQAVIDKIKSIPHPDIPFVGRVAAGSGAAGGFLAGTGLPTKGPESARLSITVNVPGGFVGDDLALARKLKEILGDDLARLAVRAS